MKKFISTLLFMLVVFGLTKADSGNVPPVAVVSSTPNQTWFYNMEDVVFSSTNSYDTDGYVNYTRFFINGDQEGSVSYMGAFTRCFALYGSPAGDCYQLTHGATTITVGFQVRDNQGEWSNITTKTYTIQQHKGRKYFITDHIGNVRATVNRDGNILGYDDYYPFGKVMQANNNANPNDNYKFTGHERDTEASLSIDYMNARTYDPITGIFMQRDPLEDQFPGWTPYHYVHNNPLNLVDPTGMRPNVPGADGDVDEKRPKKAGVEVKGTGWGAVGANLMGRNMIAGTVASANDDKKSKKDDSSRRRWRDNNFEKGTNGSIFDERGRELLGHWLNGSGDDLIINGGPWGKYMDDNKLLTAQIMEVLSIDAADRELSGDVDLTFKPAIQNGYLTGYEMLHGSYSFNLSGHAVMNKNKGSVQLSVSGVKYLSSK